MAVRAWREPEHVAPLLEAIDRISADGGVIPSTTALLGRAAEVADEHTISRDLVAKGLASSP